MIAVLKILVNLGLKFLETTFLIRMQLITLMNGINANFIELLKIVMDSID